MINKKYVWTLMIFFPILIYAQDEPYVVSSKSRLSWPIEHVTELGTPIVVTRTEVRAVDVDDNTISVTMTVSIGAGDTMATLTVVQLLNPVGQGTYRIKARNYADGWPTNPSGWSVEKTVIYTLDRPKRPVLSIIEPEGE